MTLKFGKGNVPRLEWAIRTCLKDDLDIVMGNDDLSNLCFHYGFGR